MKQHHPFVVSLSNHERDRPSTGSERSVKIRQINPFIVCVLPLLYMTPLTNTGIAVASCRGGPAPVEQVNPPPAGQANPLFFWIASPSARKDGYNLPSLVI
jgi:hypothetical protein